MENKRDKITKQAKEILGLWSKNNNSKKNTKKRISSAILAAAAGLSGLVYHGVSTLEKKEEPQIGVVNYVYTNMYKDATNNKVDTLEQGRIIKYNKDDITEWEQANEYGQFEKTLSFIRVGNILEQSIENSEEQETEGYNVNNIKDYEDVKDIYTLTQMVDEYVKCNHVDTLNFRSSPDINSEKVEKIGENSLYVCLNSEGEGEHNFKKAILVDEKGNIQQGYVADESNYISEITQEKECIGIINGKTFIRDSAELVEYDGARIEGKISNGEVVEIVDSSDETFYECKFADSDKDDTFFLSKNTVSTDIEFDFDAKFINEEPELEPTYMKMFSNSGELIDYMKYDNPIEISSDDILKVDGDKSKDGVYSVWNVTKDVVGYVDGDKLIDTESGRTIEDIYNPNKSEKEIKPETSKKDLMDQSNEIMSEYYDENRMSIVIDASNTNKSKLEGLINYFKDNKVPVSGIIFSIGSTSGKVGSIRINSLCDENSVYEEYLSDKGTVSMQQTWDEMNAELKNIGKQELPVGNNIGRGDVENLRENIEFALNNEIPVGLYYYSAEMDETEVSEVAAYCYGIDKYLNTKSSIYRNSKLKLPFTIDIEKEYGLTRTTTSNKRRAELAQRLAELLGNGIEESEASKYFGIDGHNPKDGYGILNNKVMFYSDIRNNDSNIQILLDNKYDEIKSNLEDQGYSVYLWGTSHFNCVVKMKEELTNPAIMENISKKKNYLESLKETCYNTESLVKEVVMNQAILDTRYNDGAYDISITTQDNINKMLNGKKINVPFEEAIQNSMDVGEYTNKDNGRNQDDDDFER